MYDYREWSEGTIIKWHRQMVESRCSTMHSSRSSSYRQRRCQQEKQRGWEKSELEPLQKHSHHRPRNKQIEDDPMLSVRTVNLSDQDQMLAAGKSLDRCKPVVSMVPIKDSAT
jgi:hypothetical protein